MCGPEVISVVSLKKISHKTKTRGMIYLEKLKKSYWNLNFNECFYKSYIFHGRNLHKSVIHGSNTLKITFYNTPSNESFDLRFQGSQA